MTNLLSVRAVKPRRRPRLGSLPLLFGQFVPRAALEVVGGLAVEWSVHSAGLAAGNPPVVGFWTAPCAGVHAWHREHDRGHESHQLQNSHESLPSLEGVSFLSMFSNSACRT
jgi:hypothetical protein